MGQGRHLVLLPPTVEFCLSLQTSARGGEGARRTEGKVVNVGFVIYIRAKILYFFNEIGTEVLIGKHFGAFCNFRVSIFPIDS